MTTEASPTKQARAEAILGELAEPGLMLARELAIQARATEDPDAQVALVSAFQKTSRTVRLTLALDFKLQRDAARAAREAEDAERDRIQREELAAARPRPLSPRQVRKERVRSLLNRLIWNEAEGDTEEHEILYDDLPARLDEASEVEGFEDLPIEAVARQIADDMGLSGTLTITTGGPMPEPRSS